MSNYWITIIQYQYLLSMRQQAIVKPQIELSRINGLVQDYKLHC